MDSKVGGASATGLGEDVMKGCVSYEIVRLMREGMHPQEACEKAVAMFDRELKERRGKAGDMSLIAMNNKGEWGVATNIEGFSFARGHGEGKAGGVPDQAGGRKMCPRGGQQGVAGRLHENQDSPFERAVTGGVLL